MKYILLIFNLFLNVPIFSQIPFEDKIYERMKGEYSLFTKTNLEFQLISTDTMYLYEIKIIRIDSENKHQKCSSIDFFSLEQYKKHKLKEHVITNSYLLLGVYYEHLRPSNFVINSIQKYNLSNLTNTLISDSLFYKLNKKEYYKIYKTKAVVQKYFCTSSEWSQYYFPLKDVTNSEFNYYEIVEIINRKEIKTKYSQKKINCDMRFN